MMPPQAMMPPGAPPSAPGGLPPELMALLMTGKGAGGGPLPPMAPPGGMPPIGQMGPMGQGGMNPSMLAQLLQMLMGQEAGEGEGLGMAGMGMGGMMGAPVGDQMGMGEMTLDDGLPAIGDGSPTSQGQGANSPMSQLQAMMKAQMMQGMPPGMGGSVGAGQGMPMPPNQRMMGMR